MFDVFAVNALALSKLFTLFAGFLFFVIQLPVDNDKSSMPFIVCKLLQQ